MVATTSITFCEDCVFVQTSAAADILAKTYGAAMSQNRAINKACSTICHNLGERQVRPQGCANDVMEVEDHTWSELMRNERARIWGTLGTH
eukprot:1605892-Amphidinium_carterae.1